MRVGEEGRVGAAEVAEFGSGLEGAAEGGAGGGEGQVDVEEDGEEGEREDDDEGYSEFLVFAVVVGAGGGGCCCSWSGGVTSFSWDHRDVDFVPS